jgi:hypothetical protein
MTILKNSTWAILVDFPLYIIKNFINLFRSLLRFNFKTKFCYFFPKLSVSKTLLPEQEQDAAESEGHERLLGSRLRQVVVDSGQGGLE